MIYHYLPISVVKVKKTEQTKYFEDVEQLEISHIIGSTVKLDNYFRTIWHFLINIHFP